jgi:Tfp pilus assembly protein PilZ
MRRERSKRIPYEKSVNFGPEPHPKFLAVTTNISDTGVHFQTDKVFKHGTNLIIIINSGKEEYFCEGVVSWSKMVIHYRKARPPLKIPGMGIKFSKLSKKLLDEYRDLLFSGVTCLTSDQ